MRLRISLLWFCVTFIGCTIALDKSNAYRRDEIFIDDIEGSGGGDKVKDDLESSGSGYGPDDEDGEFGSGVVYSKKPQKPDKVNEQDRSPDPPQPHPDSPGVVETDKKEDKFNVNNEDNDGLPTTPIDHTKIKFNIDDEVIMDLESDERHTSFFAQPGILAAVIGGAVVGLLCAILVVMFIVYRMRKKDEGSYPLEDNKLSPTANAYAKGSNREFFA